MNFKSIFLSIILVCFVSLLTIIMVFSNPQKSTAKTLYQVYLNGNIIGKIKNADNLYNLIDKNQQNIKDQYGVEKVYPPATLKLNKVTSYDDDAKSVDDVYNEIKKNDTFTVKGYQITIKKPISTDNEENSTGDSKSENNQKYETITINVLDKKVFNKAVESFVKAFLGYDKYLAYKNGTQSEIKETGSYIENVYFDENIKIKEALISTKEKIYTDADELSQYLLYGKNRADTEYTVQQGDTVESVAYNNKLNSEEFLIANPKITSVNNILSPGQVVNVSLINPLLTLTYEEEVVEDLETDFEQKVEYDSSKRPGYSEITQEGVKGLNRVTEKIKISNGETQNVVITKKTVLREAKTQITTRGGNGSYSTYDGPVYGSNGSWIWPTQTPYVISSPFGYRWGKLHEAFDISGCGYGSPIYAANNGVVRSAGYGGILGRSAGYNVVIEHPNGYWTVYAHMATVLVNAGQNVNGGQKIGTMGKSGQATGTHLHFGVYTGKPYGGGRPFSPAKLYS